jgi:hypothetical protein
MSKSLTESVIDWSWSYNMNQTNTATAAQDDEQHNAALRRWNHEKTQKNKNLTYVKITYLY